MANIFLIGIGIYTLYILIKAFKTLKIVYLFGYPAMSGCPDTVDDLLKRMETVKEEF